MIHTYKYSDFLIRLKIFNPHACTRGKVIGFVLLSSLLSLGTCTRVTVVVLCVCVFMCVSITALVATYLVYVSKVRQYTVSCRICIVWTSLKTFHLEDMALFTCHNDQ